MELNNRKLEVDGNLKKENLEVLNLITPILAVTAGPLLNFNWHNSREHSIINKWHFYGLYFDNAMDWKSEKFNHFQEN